MSSKSRAEQKKTKAQPATRLYAVVGSDECTVKKRAQELAKELTPPQGEDFGVERLDGAAENVEQAVTRVHQTIEAIQTFPFFASEKLVWLKDINFLGDSVVGRSAQVQGALEGLRELLAAGLPAGVNVLLSAADVDKRRSFYKALTKLARLEQFDRIDTSKAGWEEAVEGLVQHVASEKGLRFLPEALEVFVRLAGADTRQILNEIAKIDLFLDGVGEDDSEQAVPRNPREVTVDVVRHLVARTATGVIWELSTAIARRNLSESLALLEQLLFQGETAIGILLAAIIPTVRNLLVAKELCERNRLRPPQAPYQFGPMLNRLPESSLAFLPKRKDGSVNTYALGLAACEIHRFTLEELVQGLKACLTANLRLVTTQLEPRLILSDLLVKLLA